MSHSVYIDDSGAKEYITPYSKEFVDNPPPYKGNEAFWRGNYFTLCGVMIENKDLNELNSKLNQLKEECFGTTNVEIKSVWIRFPNKRKKHYLDPFGITAERLDKFGKEYIEFIKINSNKIKLFGVVFDKRWYGPARSTPEGTPLLKTTQVLFERLHSYCGGTCEVIFDQMESSLSVTRGLHNKLQGVYMKNEGLTNIYVPKYINIKDVSFKESSCENFLQVADVCAYIISRQFIDNGREWGGEVKTDDGHVTLTTYDYFDKIRCNFYSGGWFKDKVRGYGLVCIPDKAKINWDFKKESTT